MLYVPYTRQMLYICVLYRTDAVTDAVWLLYRTDAWYIYESYTGQMHGIYPTGQIQMGFNMPLDWLTNIIDYLLFYVPLKNFSFTCIWRRHHYWWRAAKLRPMLRAFEQGGIFNRATPSMTRGLGFSGLTRRTTPFNRLLRHTRGCEGSILSQILSGLHAIRVNIN
jgi:hypothetical protein